MENQAPRSDAALILYPLRLRPRHAGAVAFASHQGFFEAKLLGTDELPDRAMIDLETAPRELGEQPAQREVPLIYPLQRPQPAVARDAPLARRQLIPMPN